MFSHPRIEGSGIALMHFGRAGSTLLASMIQQNRLIYYDGELFEKVRVGKVKVPRSAEGDLTLLLKRRLKRHIFRRYLVSLKPIPEENLRPSLLNATIGELIERLVAFGFGKFIILKRTNYLNQIVSLALARQWGKYHHVQTDKPVLKRIEIPFREFVFGTFKGELLELFGRFDSYYDELESQVPGQLLVHYERDMELNPLVAYKSVADYLGLGNLSPNIALRKSNIFKNEEVIANYAKLTSYLSGSNYAWMT